MCQLAKKCFAAASSDSLRIPVNDMYFSTLLGLLAAHIAFISRKRGTALADDVLRCNLGSYTECHI